LKLLGCGDNKYGQLGLSQTEKSLEKLTVIDNSKESFSLVKDVVCGWNHTLILNDKGEAYITGRGDFGQQGNGKLKNNYGFSKIILPSAIRKIFSGSESSYAVTNENELFAWGWNEHGNLGMSHKKNTPIPIKVPLPSQTEYQIYAGGASFFVSYSKQF